MKNSNVEDIQSLSQCLSQTCLSTEDAGRSNAAAPAGTPPLDASCLQRSHNFADFAMVGSLQLGLRKRTGFDSMTNNFVGPMGCSDFTAFHGRYLISSKDPWIWRFHEISNSWVCPQIIHLNGISHYKLSILRIPHGNTHMFVTCPMTQ